MVELIPESYVACLDPAAIFGRRAPLQVDLGCGDGSFLFAVAQRNPESDFLGIERLVGRVRSAARKAQTIDNMRVLRIETSYAVRHLLPPGSVEVFYLLFPDPWPKRRHQRRRVVTSDFLNGVAIALAPGGCFRMATDQVDYFEQVRNLAADSPDFQIAPFHEDHDPPRSTFERRFQEMNAKIYRLELRKVSPVR